MDFKSFLQEVETERVWTLITCSGTKYAIGFVYMCSTSTPGHAAYNRKLYELLQKDMIELKEDGYVIMLLGDFNGHLGERSRENPNGIVGDTCPRNQNGSLFLEFIESMNMEIMNNMDLCQGTHTRVEGGRCSVVDFGIVESSYCHVIESFIIDEEGAMAQGSDHALLQMCFKQRGLRLGRGRATHKMRFNINDRTDFTIFKNEVQKGMVRFGEEVGAMSTEEKIEALQKLLIEQAKTCFKQRPYPPKVKQGLKLPKKVKEKLKELNVMRYRLMKLSLQAARERCSRAEQACKNVEVVVKGLQAEVQVQIQKFKRSLRAKVRRKGITPKTDAKTFWRMSRLSNFSDSHIHAFKTERGELVVEQERMMEEIEKEVSKTFCASKGKVFGTKEEQEELTVQAMEDLNLESIPGMDFSDEVFPLFTVDEVKDLICGLREGRAPGYDHISSLLLKNSGDGVAEFLTSIYNEIISTGEVPESLNQGIMNLIPKVKSPMTLKQRRPLTISSVIIAIFTARAAKCMAEVAEREGHLSEAAYGFRGGRSTTDCVFLLNSAIQKAKKRKITLTIASVDLEEAYDKVSRPYLFAKLAALGYTGKCLKIIQSLYFNDSVRVNVNGRFTHKLFLNLGVKQGCSLSPILFSIYINDLVEKLHKGGLGLELGKEVLSVLAFADDVLCLSSTKEGTEIQIKIIVDWCTLWKMKMSEPKTYIATLSQENKWVCDGENEYLSFEESLGFTYLGIDYRLKGRDFLGDHFDRMKKKADKYVYAILNLTRDLLDRSVVARSLWEVCAVPAVMYGSEACVVAKGVLSDLEEKQRIIAAFVTGLPRKG